MAAIMEVPSIFIFTHDSIGVGEDGPTHQPVEQLCFLGLNFYGGMECELNPTKWHGRTRSGWQFRVKTVWRHQRDCGLAGTYIISSVGTLCLGETQAMISLESNMRFSKGSWSGRQNYRLLTSEEGDPCYMVLFCNLLCWGLCG